MNIRKLELKKKHAPITVYKGKLTSGGCAGADHLFLNPKRTFVVNPYSQADILGFRLSFYS